MVIAQGRLEQGALAGEVVIVTGAGGGIGLEAARSLRWLGAAVVLAELQAEGGAAAGRLLASGSKGGDVLCVQTDVADERSVAHLVAAARERFGKIDAVVNNATYAPVGRAVAETAVEDWDRSYAVNVRGPVLLARACLPEMIARRHGVFVCVSSSGGPYLGAYESLKAAQLALANTLDAELEGTGVTAFTIGPGLVPTETARLAIGRLAPRLGMSVDQFWAANAGATLTVEAAGAGFAAAVALAERYGGQEISSTQALADAGIEAVPQAGPAAAPSSSDPARERAALAACRLVENTLSEQADGWRARSFFERQWMLRDFKQRVGMPVERCLETLRRDAAGLEAGDPAALSSDLSTLRRLADFYVHLGELASGYLREPHQREEQLQVVGRWREEVEGLLRLAG